MSLTCRVISTMIEHNPKCILRWGQFHARPLHNACKCGHLAVVKELIEHKMVSKHLCRQQLTAQIEGMHQTPLHLAAKQGYTQIVEILLKKCSELNIKLGQLRNRHDGQTPVHTAAYNGRVE